MLKFNKDVYKRQDFIIKYRCVQYLNSVRPSEIYVQKGGTQCKGAAQNGRAGPIKKGAGPASRSR